MSQPPEPPESLSSATTTRFVSGQDSYIRRRLLISKLFSWTCRGVTYAALMILLILLGSVFWTSTGRIALDFVTNTNSSDPLKAGMLAGLWGSFWQILFTALFSIPIGVGAAVYLEEMAKESFVVRVIRVNLSNLAGVPAIVYGMVGYTVFRSSAASLVVWFDGQHVINVLGLFKLRLSKLPIYEDNVLVGALTMSLVILPTVIIASQEALRAVPGSIRVASLALGATRWQTIWRQVIPAALPGISTGVILSMSRAVGEAAPLIMIGALTVTSLCPGGIDSPATLVTNPERILKAPLDQFTAMPIEIYDWSIYFLLRFAAFLPIQVPRASPHV